MIKCLIVKLLRQSLEENIKYNQKTLPRVPEECLAGSPSVQGSHLAPLGVGWRRSTAAAAHQSLPWRRRGAP